MKKELDCGFRGCVVIPFFVISTAGRNLVFLRCYIAKISHIRSEIVMGDVVTITLFLG